MTDEYADKSCRYYEEVIFDIDNPDKHERRRCGRPVYGDTDYCIYHAPLDTKEDWEFARELRKLYDETKDKYHTGPSARERTVFLDCQGFKFPEGAFDNLPREIEIPVLIGDAEVEGDVDFKRMEFRERVVFNGVVFKGRTDFEKAHFHDYVVFQQCRFPDLEGPSCWFFNTVFARSAIFKMCQFEGEPDFLETRFLGTSAFSNIEVKKTLNFYLCVFGGETLFHKICAEFKDYGYLNGFVPIIDPCAVVDFRKVHCTKPGILSFNEVNLSQWAFAQTPGIEDAAFVNVSWRLAGKSINRTRDEELLAVKEITYEDCEEMYARLKGNYEKKSAYNAASDFYVRHKLMSLKNPKTPFAKRTLLWVFYKTSNFGESAVKPLYALCFLWLLFSLVWFFKGFQFDTVTTVNYDIAWTAALDLDIKEFATDIIKSALFTFRIFVTAPSLKPDTLTEILAGVQRVCGVSLMVYLFLPAFKRLFRR